MLQTNSIAGRLRGTPIQTRSSSRMRAAQIHVMGGAAAVSADATAGAVSGHTAALQGIGQVAADGSERAGFTACHNSAANWCAGACPCGAPASMEAANPPTTMLPIYCSRIAGIGEGLCCLSTSAAVFQERLAKRCKVQRCQHAQVVQSCTDVRCCLITWQVHKRMLRVPELTRVWWWGLHDSRSGSGTAPVLITVRLAYDKMITCAQTRGLLVRVAPEHCQGWRPGH